MYFSVNVEESRNYTLLLMDVWAYHIWFTFDVHLQYKSIKLQVIATCQHTDSS